MIYFSELVNKKVYTEDKVYLGNLSDLIFLAKDQPNITKLLVKGSNKDTTLIPIQYLQKMNHIVIVNKNFETAELAENELYVLKNLLDKQIIDIQGNKIVRVNDVVIQDKPNLYVSGVDIGLLAVLRWLLVEKYVIRGLRKLKIDWVPEILSWAEIQPLELARGRVKLKTEEDKLERVRPEDLADHLEKTNIVNVRKVLNILEEEFAADVISNLNVNYQNAIFRNFPPEKSAQILSLLDPDEAVDIILTLSPQKREQTIAILSPEVKKELQYLLDLSKTPIGELITSQYLSVNSSASVKEIINEVKKVTSDFSQLNYIYMINSQQQLVGVCNLHELLMQSPETPAYRFMNQNIIVIHLTTPEEIAINKLLKYKLYALPVIDANKKILGIVTLDDIMDFVLDKIQ